MGKYCGQMQEHYKKYGAIAFFHINDAAKKEALRRGYFVLQRSGDLVHTESSEHLTVM
jgi:hypothetical protein